MDMKASIWMIAGCIPRVKFVFLVLLVRLSVLQGDGLTVNAQSPDAAILYLDHKESVVKEVAGNAALNNNNCGSLDGCSAECSRVTCYPVNGESPQCTPVDNNEFFDMCPIGACKNKILVNYNRSFVILPAPASTTLSTEVARDICLQRKLDSTFKTVSFPSEYNLIYFGSTSGAFRAFPGRERNDTQCKTFDPRKRPWYLNGISVSKEVKILVDVANSVENVVTVDYKRLPQTTYLEVEKDMVLELLQTFSPQDYVEVFSFDSRNVTSLAGVVQIDSSYNYLNPAGRPELAALRASVNSLTASTNAAPSNLDRAIVQAVNSFNTTDKLKVIVVLSDGHFVPLNGTIFPSLEIQNLHIKLMVYKLPTNDDSGDPFLLKSPSFQENICLVNGSFERLIALETVNPLYSMRSYFTYLARTQLASVDNNATWSNLYFSFSQDRSATTVTYPAYGSDGLLIGVVGLDVVIDNLNQPLQDMVYKEFRSRARGIQAPANIPMTCNYSSAPSNSICSSSTPPDSSAICPGTSTSTLSSRTCCGYDTCGLAEVRSNKLPAWAIALITLLAVALVVLVAIAGTCLCKRFTRPTPRPRDQVVEPLGNLSVSADTTSTIKEHVKLCHESVRIIQNLSRVENLLNRGQCCDLSTKLSNTVNNVQELVLRGASSVHFKSALEKLLLDLEMARSLVMKCGDEDWCRASVFQSQNENAFREILLDIGLCYNAIYEQAAARSMSDARDFPEDLRHSTQFKPAPPNIVNEDQRDLEVRLGALADEQGASVEQCLARYVLAKLNHTFEPENVNSLDTCNTVLWTKEAEFAAPWTWAQESRFLGSGSGSNGVCSATWAGIRCAKKEYHESHLEPIFLKEAGILAHLKHPCIVNFICCGNGDLKGDRFIAMELMEQPLSDLIVDAQKGNVRLSIPVVVDIMVQIARGMCYLHGQGIAHRDLKPRNVVLTMLTSAHHVTDHFCVKLVDFGMAKTNLVHASKSSTISQPNLGTRIYRAPEVYKKAHLDPGQRQKAVWTKADVFSFAITCAHLLTLREPFDPDIPTTQLYKDLLAGKRPELPSECPEELKALISDCWDISPRSRPSFVQICVRLEACRYKLLRTSPTSDTSLQQVNACIEEMITEHFETCIQRPQIAQVAGVEDTILPGETILTRMHNILEPIVRLWSYVGSTLGIVDRTVT